LYVYIFKVGIGGCCPSGESVVYLETSHRLLVHFSYDPLTKAGCEQRVHQVGELWEFRDVVGMCFLRHFADERGDDRSILFCLFWLAKA
jgi:hypothetical protein